MPRPSAAGVGAGLFLRKRRFAHKTFFLFVWYHQRRPCPACTLYGCGRRAGPVFGQNDHCLFPPVFHFLPSTFLEKKQNIACIRHIFVFWRFGVFSICDRFCGKYLCKMPVVFPVELCYFIYSCVFHYILDFIWI